MNDIQIDWYQIQQELNTIGHGQKQQYLRMICERYGVNKSKVYRELRKRFGKKKTVIRQQDDRKYQIALAVIEMKARGMQRSDKEHEMSTERCLCRLIKKGLVEGEVNHLGQLVDSEISASRCNSIIRNQIGWREPKSFVRLETQYALQEVQMDFSHSKYFKVSGYSDEAQDWILRASGRQLNYKKDDKTFKPILAGAIDHYSRLRLVRCYPGAAESTNIAFAMLNWIMTRNEDDHQLRHVPWTLGVDNGAPWKSREFNSMVEAMDIDVRNSVPFEKTGIGMVERYWQHVWQWELEWSEDYVEIPLREYNTMLHHQCSLEQELPHPNSIESRGSMYQKSILRTRPHSVDIDLIEVATRTWERTVRPDLTVSVNGQEFKVPQHVGNTWTNGRRIRIMRNMNSEWIGELIDHHAKPFTLTAPEAVQYGEFKSLKETANQKIKREIDNGFSLYRDVNTQEIVDTETGEVLQPASLKPKKIIRTADSPFSSEREETFASSYEAKIYIGAQIEQYGLTFLDVQSIFSALLEDEQPSKDQVDHYLEKIHDKLHTVQTGT